MTCTLLLLHPYRVAARSNILSGDFITRKETYTYCSHVIASGIDWTRTLPDPHVTFSVNEHERLQDGNKLPVRQDWRESEHNIFHLGETRKKMQ
jgi:hypothetical protein